MAPPSFPLPVLPGAQCSSRALDRALGRLVPPTDGSAYPPPPRPSPLHLTSSPGTPTPSPPTLIPFPSAPGLPPTILLPPFPTPPLHPPLASSHLRNVPRQLAPHLRGTESLLFSVFSILFFALQPPPLAQASLLCGRPPFSFRGARWRIGGFVEEGWREARTVRGRRRRRRETLLPTGKPQPANGTRYEGGGGTVRPPGCAHAHACAVTGEGGGSSGAVGGGRGKRREELQSGETPHRVYRGVGHNAADARHRGFEGQRHRHTADTRCRFRPLAARFPRHPNAPWRSPQGALCRLGNRVVRGCLG